MSNLTLIINKIQVQFRLVLLKQYTLGLKLTFIMEPDISVTQTVPFCLQYSVVWCIPPLALGCYDLRVFLPELQMKTGPPS